MVSIKSDREIELMKIAGHINYLCHKYLETKLKPGITTKEIDDLAGKFIEEHGCISSSKGYEGYPNNICISVNDEVVHGIGSDRVLEDGDIVSLDICMSYKGYHSDSAATYPVGTISKRDQELLDNTKGALMAGLAEVKAGAKLGTVSHAIETYAHEHGLSVVEELCGHGIGTELHENPDVPNFGKAGTGLTLKAGMTLAIEPMLNKGSRHVYLLDDDWTVITADGENSAHFEHTVLVLEDGYEILTGE